MPRRWRAPAQVTVFETVIELENVTSTQNVSVLINETVRYNATYNVTYDVLRNVTYDVTFNETYNARSRRGERHRGLNAVDARSTMTDAAATSEASAQVQHKPKKPS